MLAYLIEADYVKVLQVIDMVGIGAIVLPGKKTTLQSFLIMIFYRRQVPCKSHEDFSMQQINEIIDNDGIQDYRALQQKYFSTLNSRFASFLRGRKSLCKTFRCEHFFQASMKEDARRKKNHAEDEAAGIAATEATRPTIGMKTRSNGAANQSASQVLPQTHSKINRNRINLNKNNFYRMQQRTTKNHRRETTTNDRNEPLRKKSPR